MKTSAASPGRLRAWLDLARAGNFPSVWSNVVAALVLSSPDLAWPAPGLLAAMLLAGALAYAGGTTLNDVADAAFDRIHRPERAIPQGRISRAAAAWTGGGQLALGLGGLVLAGASVCFVLALGATILGYDWFHKRWAGSVLLMAGCRALLALSLATLPGHTFTPALLGWVAGLFLYIVGLSVLARREYRPGAPAARLGRLVRRLLAFIPLVDATALLVCGAYAPALVCALAVPTGRWAQRKAASG